MQSETQNQPEIFNVWSDKIERRLDPLYLRSIILTKKTSSRYPLVALGDLLKDSPQYGANERAIDGNPETDIRYIRITDIDEFGNLRNDDWKTARKINEKYLLNEGDVLFARSGATAGKTFVYNKKLGKAIFAGYLIRFRFDRKKVNPFFVFYYTQLNRYDLWVKSIQRPSGQPNINSEEFKSFKMHLPPPEVQNKIIAIMRKAYEEKRQKETEARKLLGSIDDYVLDELGIIIPEIESKMCFSVEANEVKDNRLDAGYWESIFVKIEKILKNCKFKIRGLTKIANIQRGILISPQNYNKGNKNYIRIADLKNLTIMPDEVVKVNFESDKGRVFENEILFTAIGATIGKLALVPKLFSGSYFSNNLTKIVATDINPHFLAYFLSAKLGQIQIKRFSTQTAQPKINDEELAKIWVIIPPFEIQNRIAGEVKRRMSRADKLKKEAKEILQQAKNRTEGIILGKS